MTIAIAKSDWQAQAQTAELEYWKGVLTKPPDEAARAAARATSAIILARLGIAAWGWEGKTIIDAGCGPTARLSGVWGARLVGIDPLALRYREVPGALMDDYAELRAVALEERIPDLAGTADLVISINCLDHCYNMAAAIANLAAYAKPGGLVCISVDVDNGARCELHPLRTTPAEIESLIQWARLTIVRHQSGVCDPIVVGGVLGWKNGWSDVETAYHWLARRSRA